MIEAVLAALLALAAEQNVTPPPGSDGLVSLSDAREFGVSPEAARFHWNRSTAHRPLMREAVMAANSAEIVWQWEQECGWRTQCWCWLDDVLYCQLPARTKLERLYWLREKIGDEAYFARRMPDPIPSYNFR